jgi:hypothetical protein
VSRGERCELGTESCSSTNADADRDAEVLGSVLNQTCFLLGRDVSDAGFGRGRFVAADRVLRNRPRFNGEVKSSLDRLNPCSASTFSPRVSVEPVGDVRWLKASDGTFSVPVMDAELGHCLPLLVLGQRFLSWRRLVPRPKLRWKSEAKIEERVGPAFVGRVRAIAFHVGEIPLADVQNGYAVGVNSGSCLALAAPVVVLIAEKLGRGFRVLEMNAVLVAERNEPIGVARIPPPPAAVESSPSIICPCGDRASWDVPRLYLPGELATIGVSRTL